MLWVAALALMMVAMMVSSVIGAEINYRRNLERRERLAALRSEARLRRFAPLAP